MSIFTNKYGMIFFVFGVDILRNAEVALYRCFYKKVFWKYTANRQENTHAEVRFP